eukprot:TRINITY_DN5382_c0_g1_i13.p2 TRINITY_DN5382_c0_g1~~TRINITY_DN5382_c0_g1_i13.p2  ORF type:complete len:342 (-),score=84.44 TRINITY_DN5382_c0_g1_i13:45-1070(-)
MAKPKPRLRASKTQKNPTENSSSTDTSPMKKSTESESYGKNPRTFSSDFTSQKQIPEDPEHFSVVASDISSNLSKTSAPPTITTATATTTITTTTITTDVTTITTPTIPLTTTIPLTQSEDHSTKPLKSTERTRRATSDVSMQVAHMFETMENSKKTKITTNAEEAKLLASRLSRRRQSASNPKSSPPITDLEPKNPQDTNKWTKTEVKPGHKLLVSCSMESVPNPTPPLVASTTAQVVPLTPPVSPTVPTCRATSTTAASKSTQSSPPLGKTRDTSRIDLLFEELNLQIAGFDVSVDNTRVPAVNRSLSGSGPVTSKYSIPEDEELDDVLTFLSGITLSR